MTRYSTPQRRQDVIIAYIFSFPALLGLLVFILIPFCMTIFLSFTNLRLGSPLPLEFVGTIHYKRIFTDSAFLNALRNNIVFAFFVVPVQTCLALLMALCINQPLRGMFLFRTLFFMPVVFPLSLISVVWILVFAPGTEGTLNSLLDWLSFGIWQPHDFLHDPNWALPAIALVSIWQGVGFQMVILLAALQAVPVDLHEAAQMDGAGRLQQFIHITLPHLRNALVFVILVTTILAFRLFDQVQIMTQGGPNNATTTVIYESVNAAFANQQIARGAAMTTVFFTIVLVLTLLQRYAFKQEKTT